MSYYDYSGIKIPKGRKALDFNIGCEKDSFDSIEDTAYFFDSLIHEVEIALKAGQQVHKIEIDSDDSYCSPKLIVYTSIAKTPAEISKDKKKVERAKERRKNEKAKTTNQERAQLARLLKKYGVDGCAVQPARSNKTTS